MGGVKRWMKRRRGDIMMTMMMDDGGQGRARQDKAASLLSSGLGIIIGALSRVDSWIDGPVVTCVIDIFANITSACILFRLLGNYRTRSSAV